MAKSVTREQAERKRQQAVTLMERIGDTDRAEEFDDMSVEEYAEHRGLDLVSNPRRNERKQSMATKTDLQEQLDNAAAILDGAYTPEASREDIAAAVGQALDILNGEDDDSDEDEEDDEEEGE
jgi:hypothetical protein